jgi:hypothetical protein
VESGRRRSTAASKDQAGTSWPCRSIGFFDEQNLNRLRSADTLLLGATTYTGLKGYWPAVAETSEVSITEVSITVIANPDVADLLREIDRRNNEIRKVVVSDSVTEDGTAPRTGPRPSCDARGCATGRCRAQGPAGRGHPRVPEPDALERTAGRQARRRAVPDMEATVLGGGTPTFDAGRVHPLRLLSTRGRAGSDTLLLLRGGLPR